MLAFTNNGRPSIYKVQAGIWTFSRSFLINRKIAGIINYMTRVIYINSTEYTLGTMIFQIIRIIMFHMSKV